MRTSLAAVAAGFLILAAGCSGPGEAVDVTADAAGERVVATVDATALSNPVAAEFSTTTAAARTSTTSLPTPTTAAHIRSTTTTTAQPASDPGEPTTTTVPPVSTTVPTRDVPPPTTTTTQPPEPTADPAVAGCSEPEGGVLRPSTEKDFVEALAQQWLLCNAPSVFGTNEAGLAIDPDGTWYKLQRRIDGSLAPMDGWDNSGWWEVIDTSMMNGPGSYQLNLHISGSGTVIVHPVFAVNVVKMRLDNMGVHVADYVEAPQQ